MKNEFCTYEQSLALKELGFDNNELKYQYINKELKDNIFIPQIKPNGMEVISAPLIQQAFRFFREKYGLVHEVHYYKSGELFEALVFSKSEDYLKHLSNHTTYEEAEQSCLNKLIELAKDK